MAMALGIALGLFAPTFDAKMQILGDAIIKAIRVVHRASDLLHGRSWDCAHVRHGPGRPRRSQGIFEVLTTIALIISLVMVNVLKPGVGMNVDLSKVDTTSVQSYIAHKLSTTTLRVS